MTYLWKPTLDGIVHTASRYIIYSETNWPQGLFLLFFFRYSLCSRFTRPFHTIITFIILLYSGTYVCLYTNTFRYFRRQWIRIMIIILRYSKGRKCRVILYCFIIWWRNYYWCASADTLKSNYLATIIVEWVIHST